MSPRYSAGGEPFLTQDAQFILTEYRVKVLNVLRGVGLTAGSTIPYIRPGGKLLIDGRPVRAVHNVYPELDQNHG